MKSADKSKHKPAWLPFRHRAEEAVSSLPDLMMAAERAAESVLAGDHRQRKVGSGERFWQFRDYDPSDRPQDIDWRQSGKGDRVFVRQKERQTTQTVLLWVQGDKGMSYASAPALPEKKTEAITMALALGLMLTRRGELVRLLDGQHRPGRGSPSLAVLGEDLLRLPAQALPHPAMRDIPKQAGIILIGDFLSDSAATGAMMDALAARVPNGLLIQVLDPAELTLPFSGRVVFEDMATDKDHQIQNVESVRDAYSRRIDAHMDALRTMAQRHRWQWVLHRTDADLKDTLFKIWALIGSDDSRNPGS